MKEIDEMGIQPPRYTMINTKAVGLPDIMDLNHQIRDRNIYAGCIFFLVFGKPLGDRESSTTMCVASQMPLALRARDGRYWQNHLCRDKNDCQTGLGKGVLGARKRSRGGVGQNFATAL
jgi:hypothetical protein